MPYPPENLALAKPQARKTAIGPVMCQRDGDVGSVALKATQVVS